MEELFKPLLEKAEGGTFSFYNVYADNAGNLEVVDVEVNTSDPESVKRYLDRTTRETLEREVLGFRLIATVMDKGGEYIFSSQEVIDKDSIVETIERLKEV